MIIYNTTVKVANEILTQWLQWMKQEQIPAMMDTGLFSGNRLCRLLEQDETEGATFVVQYFCDSMENYNTFIAEHAVTLRDKGFKLFGNRFIAFNTVMEAEN